MARGKPILRSVSLYLWLGIICLFLAQPGQAQQIYIPAEAWQGELLPQGYGALYVRLKLSGFKKSSRGTSMTTNVFLHFQDEKQNRRYTVSQAVQESETGVQVWKLPIGNFLLYKVSLTDNTGRLRTWQVAQRAREKSTVGIRHLFLSNMGILSLSPAGNASLMVRILPQTNVFKNTYKHDAFAGVIDAYNLKVQERLGGKTLFAEAEGDFSSSDEVRAAFSFQRQIAMIYKLDVGKQKKFTTKLISTLAAQDLDLRRCYMEELDKTPNLKGNVAFNFMIDRSDGVMQKIQYRGGNIKNNRLTTCLYYTLGKMQFPVTSNVGGNITFYFSFSDEPGRKVP